LRFQRLHIRRARRNLGTVLVTCPAGVRCRPRVDLTKEKPTRYQQPLVRPSSVRKNRNIRAPRILVIDPDGASLGVLATSDALRRASELGLDLVEVDPRSDPPVCKILDAGRQRYVDDKNKRTARSAGPPPPKEIRLRPGTDAHDLAVKAAHVARFLSAGARTKVVVRFRGRELRHPENGRAALEKLLAAIGASDVQASPIAMEGRLMSVTLTPRAKA
jgi:translation initiation factor IF-3